MKFAAVLGISAAAAGLVLTVPVQASAQPAPGCHASYDPCVPITSDVDCAGGSGNGPEYTGRVRVIGPDEYGLDRDGNGIGCENS
ncbi:hypothetical protein [Nocardia vermiculata]|uniref:Excalibur calcium-binding domain-containing protein n=1 Tax=Nocardia vermiculata TaxID=257274 RepID=A0A846Y036_9NOCA|nr:hypothetical protein [Nocardia vermiculata]NKY51452.1 hypothetical protein [Nocardia vermiculata]